MKHTSSFIALWENHHDSTATSAVLGEVAQRTIASTDQDRLPIVSRPWPSSLQWVGVLAFGQSLLFLALWLWVCASAGAATAEPANWKAEELKLSVYQPATNRDPFVPGGVAMTGAAKDTVTPAEPTTLRLQGILYEPRNPSAMVNNRIVTLNKPVTLSTESGEVEVTATEITRERVVVTIGGKPIELRLGQPSAGITENASKP